ncbi:hypothetical protein FAF44_50980, partial [Nonomuraea sp. MG754425]|uniref:hypothetical protein n=1 Tax=Nonomuraea sp. MG754425 TaxID=2570319 RepID=UPI001F28DBDD
MYRHTAAVATAVSAAALLAFAAAPADAENEAAPAVECSNRDGYSYNMSPPPPMSGDVSARDVEKLVNSIIGGARLGGSLSTGAPLGVGAESDSPIEDRFEDLLSRALKCAHATSARGAKLPPKSAVGTDPIVQGPEALAAPSPAASPT